MDTRPKRWAGHKRRERPCAHADCCRSCREAKAKCAGSYPCQRCFRNCLNCRVQADLDLEPSFPGTGGGKRRRPSRYLELAFVRSDHAAMARRFLAAFDQLKREGSVDVERTLRVLRTWHYLSLSLGEGQDLTWGVAEGIARALRARPADLLGHEGEEMPPLNAPAETRIAWLEERRQKGPPQEAGSGGGGGSGSGAGGNAGPGACAAPTAAEREGIPYLRLMNDCDAPAAVWLVPSQPGEPRICSNARWDRMYRPAWALYAEARRHKAIQLLLTAAAVAPEDRDLYFGDVARALFTASSRKSASVLKMLNSKGNIRLYIWECLPLSDIEGQHGLLIRVERVPASRHMTDRPQEENELTKKIRRRRPLWPADHRPGLYDDPSDQSEVEEDEGEEEEAAEADTAAGLQQQQEEQQPLEQPQQLLPSEAGAPRARDGALAAPQAAQGQVEGEDRSPHLGQQAGAGEAAAATGTGSAKAGEPRQAEEPSGSGDKDAVGMVPGMSSLPVTMLDAATLERLGAMALSEAGAALFHIKSAEEREREPGAAHRQHQHQRQQLRQQDASARAAVAAATSMLLAGQQQPPLPVSLPPFPPMPLPHMGQALGLHAAILSATAGAGRGGPGLPPVLLPPALRAHLASRMGPLDPAMLAARGGLGLPPGPPIGQLPTSRQQVAQQWQQHQHQQKEEEKKSQQDGRQLLLGQPRLRVGPPFPPGGAQRGAGAATSSRDLLSSGLAFAGPTMPPSLTGPRPPFGALGPATMAPTPADRSSRLASLLNHPQADSQPAPPPPPQPPSSAVSLASLSSAALASREEPQLPPVPSAQAASHQRLASALLQMRATSAEGDGEGEEEQEGKSAEEQDDGI